MTTENVKSGTFDYPHDLDTFRVDMVTGQRYLFSLKGTGTSPATSMGLQVLNSKGELQVFDFEIGAGGEAKLSFVSPTTDPYYVMVGNIDPATQGIEAGLGSYELTANTLSLDDHADLKADGTALAVGVTKAGAFDQPHDFDYFKIDLFAGQRYLFEMKGAGADPLETMEMLLLGSNGERVEFDVSSGVSAKSQISYVPVSSATYYLLASNDHFTDFGFTDGIGTYQVSVTGLALDDYGDLLPQAALLLPGQPRTGAFDVTDDLDYFKYDMRAGQRYVIDMTWLGNNTGGGTELRVYDPAGKEVIYDLRATGEPSSQIAFQIAGEQCLQEAARAAGIVLLEPIMEVNVQAPGQYIGDLTGDTSRRRGEILNSGLEKGRAQLHAYIPLASLFGYSSDLRNFTSGTASFIMEPSHYAPVKEELADIRPDMKKAG